MDYQNAYHLKNELRSQYRPDMTNGVCYEGDQFLARLSARDPEKQTVEYLLTGGALPKGAFLDPSAGTITGRLTLEHFDSGETLKGDHTWYFTVSGFDGVNFEPQDFAITVKHINLPVQWDDNVGGPILEMYEGNSIAQATVFVGTQIFGSTGNTVIRANAVPISGVVNFNGSLAQTARDICNSINSTVSSPEYTATYINGPYFKVANAAGYGVNVTAHSNGNIVAQRVVGDTSILRIDGLGNETSDVANTIGFKVLGAHDPEHDFQPLVSPAPTFSATGPLFDRNDLNAIQGSTLTMNSNGVMTGSLPQINGNSGQVVGKAGGAFPFNIYAYDGEYYAAREFSILVKNTNQPPVFNDVPADGADIGPTEEAAPFSYTFHAYDPDGDTLTWSVSNVVAEVGNATFNMTLADIGLSINPSTGELSGTPTNANIPPDENVSNVVWYLASPNGVSASPADSSYYVWDPVSGVNVFQSKPGETLFVTTATDASVAPTIGQKYRVTYSIRMVQASSNGLPSFERPAFDGFQTGNPQPFVLGQRSGPGYVSSVNNVGYDFFDPLQWGLNNWVAITCDYTVNQSFAQLRGRIRINRTAINAGGPPYWNGSGYINRTDGPPYPNAVFQLRGYSITLRASATYRFTVHVTDGEYTTSREFRLSVGNQDLAPVWVTASNLGNFTGNGYVNLPLYANDPEGGAITYTLTGGSVSGSGAALQFGSGNSSATLVGTLANAAGSYSFTLSASDGTQTVPRTFNFSVTPAAGNVDLPPVWVTPAGNLGSAAVGSSGPSIDLDAYDPEGQPVTFSSGDLPGTLNLNPSSGVITGTMPSPAGTYTFTVDATANAVSTSRTFNIVSTVSPDLSSRTYTVPGFNTGPGQYVVPEGVTSVLVEWTMAGGGGGGTGTQVGPGGGGGGGGSGGYQQNVLIPVATGDTIDVTIGGGGAGGIGQNAAPYGRSGSAGGDTVIYKNGVEVHRVYGGQGGTGNSNTVKKGTLPAPGGPGGTPNGSPGADGQIGTSDYASSTGGDGASSPLGTGGQGGALGYGHVEGNPGAGYGAGGGGGGSYDRSGPHEWNGGNGSGGYLKFTPQL